LSKLSGETGLPLELQKEKNGGVDVFNAGAARAATD
jgi:hypothetical protein